MIITDQHLKEVCKIGQGKNCCRYLIMGMGGFQCAKFTNLKEFIDKRVLDNNIIARSNNCEGK